MVLKSLKNNLKLKPMQNDHTHNVLLLALVSALYDHQFDDIQLPKPSCLHAAVSLYS